MKLPRFIVRYLDRLAAPRPPDEIIGRNPRSRAPHKGPPVERPFLRRWLVIPKNRLFNIYYHNFIADDEDRALHDHPWANASCVTHGQYREILPHPNPIGPWHYKNRIVRPGQWVFRRATDAHRVELIGGQPSWSLFLTGPITHTWGFLCNPRIDHHEFHERGGC